MWQNNGMKIEYIKIFGQWSWLLKTNLCNFNSNEERVITVKYHRCKEGFQYSGKYTNTDLR